MRGFALGLGAAVSFVLMTSSAGAASLQIGQPPLFVNDRDGGVVPNRGQDPDFVLNPDGDEAANYTGDSDQDEGGDIAIYQGEDDTLPA